MCWAVVVDGRTLLASVLSYAGASVNTESYLAPLEKTCGLGLKHFPLVGSIIAS